MRRSRQYADCEVFLTRLGRCVPLLFLLSACGKAPPEQSEKTRLQAEYERDFIQARILKGPKGYERKLVESFVISMSDEFDESERERIGKPFLKRLAAGKEDPFLIYRDYKKLVNKKASWRVNMSAVEKEAWDIMDRYSRERPDLSKSRIERRVAPVDLGDIFFFGEEEIHFTPLPLKEPGTTIGAIAYCTYIQRTDRFERDQWGFLIEDRRRYATSTSNLWGSGRKPAYDTSDE
jgi:hypothetical protein